MWECPGTQKGEKGIDITCTILKKSKQQKKISETSKKKLKVHKHKGAPKMNKKLK